ncbi:MAG: hypothetical protein ACI8WB_005304 [Phenylobacterium sp.]
MKSSAPSVAPKVMPRVMLRVAILAADQPGFVSPMAKGLQKMLSAVGAEAEIFSQGLAMLNFSTAGQVKTLVKNRLKAIVNQVQPQRFLLQPQVSATEVKQFLAHLSGFDVIVVVCHIPDAFLAAKLSGIEKIRQNATTQQSIPIVLYQNYYLATRGDWYQKIKGADGFGLERYDWYFAASVVSEYPLSSECHPYSHIGHDLADGSLYVEPTKAQLPFKVLLDFERPGFEQYRLLQIEALEKTNTPYTQLRGRYSLADIRAIYRAHSALFLSFRESFGLPIVENQLCGNTIFAPYISWVPSHQLDKPLSQAGLGTVGRNFKLYDNQLEPLMAQIEHCRDNYQPDQVVADFQQQYPQLAGGDLVALQGFVDKVANGEISGCSHQHHGALNDGISG